MNLYIWGDQGTVKYGVDSLVVMASSLREARKAARKTGDWSYGREHKGRKNFEHITKNKPDRIIRNRAYAIYFMVEE
jgi:hypothetical protein